MKKVFLKSILAMIVAVSMSSCMGVHSGTMASSANLSSANFSYVKQSARGSATATYILGIGGISRETLVEDAKLRLLANNPLKSNQALANLTVNFKVTSYVGYIYRTATCVVTADIVEFK